MNCSASIHLTVMICYVFCNILQKCHTNMCTVLQLCKANIWGLIVQADLSVCPIPNSEKQGASISV